MSLFPTLVKTEHVRLASGQAEYRRAHSYSGRLGPPPSPRDVPSTSSSSSEEKLLQDLRDRLQRRDAWPGVLALGFVIAGILAAGDADWRLWTTVLMLTMVSVFTAAFLDRRCRQVVVLYELDYGLAVAHQRLVTLFSTLKTGEAVCSTWPGEGPDSVLPVRFETVSGGWLRSNLRLPSLCLGGWRWYFLPDRLLVRNGREIRAVGYESFRPELRMDPRSGTGEGCTLRLGDSPPFFLSLADPRKLHHLYAALGLLRTARLTSSPLARTDAEQFEIPPENPCLIHSFPPLDQAPSPCFFPEAS